ncbi:glycosyltransferase family 4 protein [Allorhizobium pseudoryzae]|uniref:glycosyltransferase family 4 protein n=1 Tax=Allorhizobium pseudoryzae TaxID=379684 RepID=UPI003CFCE35E
MSAKIMIPDIVKPLRKALKEIKTPFFAKIGHVDELSLTRVSGWAIKGRGTRPAKVAVLLAGQVVAKVEANGLRPDVKAAGFGTEICGFDIKLDLAPRDLFGNNIRVVILSRGDAPHELHIPSKLRPWAVGFWDETNQPLSERWQSLAQRARSNADLLPPKPIAGGRSKNFLLEGPVRGDYSLSIVNRSFAKAILVRGHNVTLVSDDINLHDDPMFNSEAALVKRYDNTASSENFDVHSLNTWPPETSQMKAPVRTLHCYAWEESAFPPKFLNGFNRDLDLVCAASAFTEIALRHSGLSVPVVVTGNGIDPALFALRRRSRSGRFRFLHISSCFARKAADKLVQAFVEEFENENVELHIKTFDNPHNNIRDIVGAYGQRARNISLSFANLPIDAIHQLYQEADCLVAASRGEGFLLTAAEAMAVGVPVITTDAGGQSDFCDNTTSWLVKSTAVSSGTHMSLGASYWYEPDLQSLRHQMRMVYQASETEILAKTGPAREIVRSTYTWDKVSQRYLYALESIGKTARQKARLALVSTWNQSCGIATYSQELLPHLAEHFEIEVFAELVRDRTAADEPFVFRTWSRQRGSMPPLADAVMDGEFDAVLVQHHPSHFSWADLAYLVDSIVQGSRGRVKVFIQLHSSAGQLDAIQASRLSFARVDTIFVHTMADVEALGPIAADTRVAVVPHGIPVLPEAARRASERTCAFHIGSFGFCMPHKGIMNHLRSLAIIRNCIPNLKATLLHAVNDDEKTIRHAAEVRQLIHQLSLEDVVEIDFRFLEKIDVARRLADCDLLVLPYQNNQESASGAIRDVLGISVPILATSISTFNDVEEFIFTTKTNHPLDLAHKIMMLHSDPAYRASKMEKQMEHVQSLSWKIVTSRMANIMQGVL